MMLLICSILVIPALIVSAEGDTAITEPIPTLIWAATDPEEDSEAAKINSTAFYLFTEKHRQEFLEYWNAKNVIGITSFLHKNAQESGTEGVIWTKVFGKIIFKTLSGQSEDKEHGFPSLIVWAVRNTGVGTKLTSVDRKTLVSFLFNHKSDITKLINDGDVAGLINLLESTKSTSGSKDIDWKTQINDLKENRQLFKHACGLLGLRLCDTINN